MYQYWGFGLNIESEIIFPELLPAAFEHADVQVQLRNVAAAVTGMPIVGAKAKGVINSDEFFFEPGEAARYYAAGGNHITIELLPGVDVTDVPQMRAVRIYTLATVFAAILLQRQMLPLHASAVMDKGGLVLVTGHSGAGKSTTLAGLHKNGYKVFSDDVVVLHRQPEGIKACAAYPMIKLWDDAQQKIDDDRFNDRSFLVKNGMNKYGIFFHETFDKRSYDIKKIFVLKKYAGNEITSTQLTDSAAFNQLSQQLYRPSMVHSNELRALCFMTLTDVVKRCSMFEVCRPQSCHPDALLEHIQQLMDQH